MHVDFVDDISMLSAHDAIADTRLSSAAAVTGVTRTASGRRAWTTRTPHASPLCPRRQKRRKMPASPSRSAATTTQKVRPNKLSSLSLSLSLWRAAPLLGSGVSLVSHGSVWLLPCSLYLSLSLSLLACLSRLVWGRRGRSLEAAVRCGAVSNLSVLLTRVLVC